MGGCAVLPAWGSPWLPSLSPAWTLLSVMSLFSQCPAGSCLSLEKMCNRLWVLSFPSRSKNHLVAMNSKGISNCSDALVEGLCLTGSRAGAESPNVPPFLSRALGSGVDTRTTGQDVSFCGLEGHRGSLELLPKEGGTMVKEEGTGGTGDPSEAWCLYSTASRTQHLTQQGRVTQRGFAR